MFVFIDAYNVLKTMKGVNRILPREAEMFVRHAQKRAAARGYRVIIVFDAGEGTRPTTYEYSDATIVYSGSQNNADDILIRLIEQSHGQEKLLVTADRSLRRRGLACGAQPVDPATYWNAIYEKNEAEKKAFSQYCATIDVGQEYSSEELKAIAFSTTIPPKDEEKVVSRRSSARVKSKAVKKFEKIKERL